MTTQENPWEDDPEYPSSEWRQDVAEDNTRLGYLEWGSTGGSPKTMTGRFPGYLQ